MHHKMNFLMKIRSCNLNKAVGLFVFALRTAGFIYFKRPWFPTAQFGTESPVPSQKRKEMLSDSVYGPLYIMRSQQENLSLEHLFCGHTQSYFKGREDPSLAHAMTL